MALVVRPDCMLLLGWALRCVELDDGEAELRVALDELDDRVAVDDWRACELVVAELPLTVLLGCDERPRDTVPLDCPTPTADDGRATLPLRSMLAELPPLSVDTPLAELRRCPYERLLLLL